VNRTVSLSQFMPYGAPDLIEAAPRHLSRAVMASSGLAVAAFVLLCAVVSLLPPPALPIVPLPPVIDIGPPPLLPEPLPPPSRPATRIAPPQRGVPVPVTEPVPSEIVEPAGPPGDIGRRGFGDVDGRGDARPIAPAPPPVVVPEEPLWFADELPMPIASPEPRYPEFAKDAGVEGLVVVQVMVGKDGKVVQALVPPRFSIPLLDGAALEAARRWVFKPAYTNGRPVAVWVALRFRFSLR
jgi:protein TonB